LLHCDRGGATTLVSTPQLRAERLIAGGRVVLAGSSLFAVWLDPTEPAKYAAIAYSLLAAYLGYSLVIAALGWRLEPSAPQRIGTHVFDLAFFSVFLYFTAGASPFIAYFVFSLVCATVRWQWKGTFWTAVASLATFLGLGVYFAEVVRDPAFALNAFVIRAVYLAVIAVLLGYLGAHEQRTRDEMARLLRERAATEERMRLARDLHDGALQSFTGIGLRVATAARLLEEDPAAAAARLRELQRLVAGEQRDLRFFIAELNPPPGGAEGGPDLEERLTELAERVEREWQVRVDLEAAGLAGAVPDDLARDAYNLVREALMNALRHGAATAVRVRVGLGADGRLAIAVADNGRGFPFHGRYSERQLAELGLGPRSLRERVEARRGSLALASGPTGASLEIALPLAAAG
jgi:signal transduction histidine kinase